MSIKESLEAFVAHVKSLEDEDEGGDDGYTKDFQALKHKSNQYRMEGTFSTSQGERDCNRRKNRYKDILPFDYTRVMLPEIPGQQGSDYINANFIKGATGQQTYIASQGPLTHTVPDFWWMVWSYKVRVIIMTSNEYEAGKMKCACYWPKAGEEKHYSDMTVTLGEEREIGGKDFIVRELHLLRGDEVRVIHQLHYVAWPDHGVPISVKPLLDIVAVAREYQSGDMPPIVIHCSAGCGRTGTLCAIDYAWTLLKLGRLDFDFNLFEIIMEMRKQRPSIVQALDQYILVHHAVVQLFNSFLQMFLEYETHSSAAASQPPRSRSPYENVTEPQDSAFQFCVNEVNPTTPIISVKSPNGEYDDVLCHGDIVQKCVRENVNNLIQSAPALGIHLLPPRGQTPGQSPAHIRHAASPRVRLHRSEIENGYTQIQLQHPLPVPRRTRMDRNSSSSSSHSSTSSASGLVAERCPVDSRPVEPDYEVLSRTQTLNPRCVDSSSTVVVPPPCATLPGGAVRKFQNREYDNVQIDPAGRVVIAAGPPHTGPPCQPAGNPRFTFLPLQEPLDTGNTQPMDTQSGFPGYSATLPQMDSQGAVRYQANLLYDEAPGPRSSVMIQENLIYAKANTSPRHVRSASESGSALCSVPPTESRTNPVPIQMSPDEVPLGHVVGQQPQPSSKSPVLISPHSPDGASQRPPMPLPRPRQSPTLGCKPSDQETFIDPQAKDGLYSYSGVSNTSAQTMHSSGQPKKSEYSYADPNALGKWSLQHIARGVPFDAVLEGDYAELAQTGDTSMAESVLHGRLPLAPPRRKDKANLASPSNPFMGEYDEVRITDDAAAPEVPQKSQSCYQSIEAGEEDEMVTGPLSRSLDTLSESVTTGVMTFGRKIKQKVQQTFGRQPSNSCPGPELSTLNAASPAGNVVYYKGRNISFPNRVRQPRGPRGQLDASGSGMPIRKMPSQH